MGNPRGMFSTAVLLLLAASTPATAAPSDVPWSVDSGKTIGSGNAVLWGEAGFPFIGVEFAYGLDHQTDIGAIFAFGYGDGGIVSNCCSGDSISFALALRRNFFDNGKIWIAGTFNPGIGLFFVDGLTQVSLGFPVGLQFGFPVSREVIVNATFDLPMAVAFASDPIPGYFSIQILFGGGVEFHPTKELALTFQLKLGPALNTVSGSSAQFALDALFGAAYRF